MTQTPRRRPRLTAEDISNIFDALEFIRCGESSLYEGDPDEEKRWRSFERTHKKISRS